MNLALKMGFRNLKGAGLRTWLNVTVLSFSFVVIIWHRGLLDGWDKQARHDMINWELGGGQYWHEKYDPYDQFTLQESHAKIPGTIYEMVQNGNLVPILITEGTLYPGGRMKSVLVKGIDPKQKALSLPSYLLDSVSDGIPAIIGSAMASSAKLGRGDVVTLRWRDKNGAFDAAEITIAGVFQTTVPTVDGGQIWIPLEKLQKMLLLEGEASMIVCSNSEIKVQTPEGWVFKSQDFLLMGLDKIIKTKSISGVFMWAILLLLAMLAVFDTQVLSIFRRQKEIGTYVALGMTRGQVVMLFTVEGALNSVLAALLGAVYGIPLLTWQALKGMSLPGTSSDYGLAMADKLYPVYSLELIFGTVLIVMIVTTIVSYWPSRKIAKMKPTDALRGRIQ
jgi:putative ABC transport system permease protein